MRVDLSELGCRETLKERRQKALLPVFLLGALPDSRLQPVEAGGSSPPPAKTRLAWEAL